MIGCDHPTTPSDEPEQPVPEVVKFTVTFETEKGTAPAALQVEKDTILTTKQLAPLTAEGFTFKGWFDGETLAKGDEYKVTADVTLKAKWEAVTPPPAPEQPPAPPAQKTIFGAWETVIKDEGFPDTKVRLLLKEDFSCYASYFVDNTDYAELFYLKGTFTDESNTTAITFTQSNLDYSSNWNTISWNTNLDMDILGWAIEFTELQKYTLNEDTLSYNLGDGFIITFKRLPSVDITFTTTTPTWTYPSEALLGGWTTNENMNEDSSHLLLNEDETFILATKQEGNRCYFSGSLASFIDLFVSPNVSMKYTINSKELKLVIDDSNFTTLSSMNLTAPPYDPEDIDFNE